MAAHNIANPTSPCAGRRSAEAADHDLRRVAGRRRTLVLQVYYTPRTTANRAK
jgi:hypothetical protein